MTDPSADQPVFERVATIRARRDGERNLTHYDVLVDPRVLDVAHKASMVADIIINVAPTLIARDLADETDASPPA